MNSPRVLPTIRTPGPWRWFLPALAGLAALGCGGNDDIRRYEVPRSTTPPTRILAAILNAPKQVWFFKLTGPGPEVEQHVGAFEEFVRSVAFPESDKPPITWTVPAGWSTRESNEKMRYATFRIDRTSLELTVTPLGRESGDLLGNVNRWREQINLEKITDAELPGLTRKLAWKGGQAILVDMTGRPLTRPSAPAQAAKAAAPALPRAKVTAQIPAGWEEIPATGMRVAAYRVPGGGEKPLEVTVIPLSGPAGGLLANVNRWRTEVGLPEIDDAQLRKEAQPIESPQAAGFVVDLPGPEAAGAKRERTLGAILLHQGTSWFVKLRGPADAVARQRDAFLALVRSLRFDSAPEAHP